MKFTDFNLHPNLQKGIDEAEYTTCMPVQEQVLSNAFNGHDLYVQSQTGTGKTAAFLTVIFQRMLTEEALFKRKALIIAPTRELAVQIEEEAKTLGKHLPFKTGAFYGGVGYTQQEKLLRENAQILVGTPGRVLDLNKSGRMNLMDIAFLVLDEADRMFDMGFYPDLRKLINVIPSVDRRQTMLFSATLNAWVKNLAWEYTKTPFEIEIKPENVTVEEITQVLYHVPSEEKMPLLLGIMKHEQPDSTIIFCNTKKHTEIVAKRLRMNDIPCEFIIGDLPQVKRLKVIDDVKAGKIKTLVATDVAARGLDIESLSMVINYDVPAEAENYVHRIGRTARAGKTGKAFTLASEHDVYELPAIERYIGKKVPSEVAGQELYAEDKSAHQYIQTDYYEEHKQSPRHPKGARREGKTSRRGKEEQRITKINTFGVNNKGISTKGIGANKKGAKHNSKPRYEAVDNNKTDNRQDLSQLTMEERMALYKKKYARPGSVSHASGYAHRESKDRKKHNTRHHRHEHKMSVSKNGGKSSVTANPVATEKTGKQQAASVKKGFFTKLIGLFKK